MTNAIRVSYFLHTFVMLWWEICFTLMNIHMKLRVRGGGWIVCETGVDHMGVRMKRPKVQPAIKS